MTDFIPAVVNDGRTEMNGRIYMPDAKGAMWPVESIKPQHLLEDETVRKIIGYGLGLSSQISRFKAHTFEDLGTFDALLAQEYGAKKGGAKGNRTYQSFDGLYRVEVRVNDQLDFGPELQIAKSLFDECLNEWSADARAELRLLVTSAFDTAKEGTINRTALFQLLRVDSDDARWQRATQALRDAMRVVGSRTYVRLSQRETLDARWSSITIDLAAA